MSVTDSIGWFTTGALFFIAWLAAVLLTGSARAYALRRALLDIPNERSSHTVATPRGGGLAIAITLAIGVMVLGLFEVLSINVAWALLGGGTLVAGVGWLDDHRHVAPRWRVLVHLLAAVWALYWLGGLSELMVGEVSWNLGWLGSLLAVLGIVWLINLYNFMDGIDGLAGVEAVTTGVGGALLLWWLGAPGLAMAALLVAVASGGFLVWNWPPAKIFMGDVGSGLLGYCFAVLALAGEKSGALPATVWLLLLGVFVMDATFTLIHRVIRGERWYTGHRSHAYQRLVQMGYPHRQVSLIVAGLNVLLLLPAAAFSAVYPGTLFGWLTVMAVGGWLLWNTVNKRFRDATPAK